MKISATERGTLWLFTVDLPTSDLPTTDLDAFKENELQTALGASHFDTEQTEVFDVEVLGDMTLADFLIEAYEVDKTEIEPLRAQLARHKGPIALIRSAAFEGTEQTLTPQSPLRHIATLQEGAQDFKFEALKSESAKRQSTPPADEPAPKKQVSDAAMSGRVATVALLVIFAFTALFIWIGG